MRQICTVPLRERNYLSKHLRLPDETAILPSATLCDGEFPLKSKKRKKSAFGKDRRRKHHHWLVTVYYPDGEKFGRVYTDHGKATRFAARQRRSPVVKSARITQLS